jgi:hypothetical protein
MSTLAQLGNHEHILSCGLDYRYSSRSQLELIRDCIFLRYRFVPSSSTPNASRTISRTWSVSCSGISPSLLKQAYIFDAGLSNTSANVPSRSPSPLSIISASRNFWQYSRRAECCFNMFLCATCVGSSRAFLIFLSGQRSGKGIVVGN